MSYTQGGERQPLLELPRPKPKPPTLSSVSTTARWAIVLAIIALIAALAHPVPGDVALAWLKNGFSTPKIIADNAMLGQVNVTGMFDISLSHIKTAPEFIIVGKGVEGVEDWPISVLQEAKFAKSYYDRAAKRAKTVKIHPEKAKRGFPQQLPIYPSAFPTIAWPPPGALYVDTIKEALDLLQGKVLTNTTIALRAGTYNETVVLDGFLSNCGQTASTAKDNISGNACRGLNFIGDARRIAGYTYVQGAVVEPFTPPHPAIGSDGGVNILTCLNDTTVQIERTLLPYFWNYITTQPDFEVLGVVPGDKMTFWSETTGEFSDKTVVSVSGNVIVFNETGCQLDIPGSSVTFLPNRRIVGHSIEVLPYSFENAALNSANTTGGVLIVAQTVNIIGLHVMTEAAPYNNYYAICAFTGYGLFFSNIVCDARVRNKGFWQSLIIYNVVQGGLFAPNTVQNTQLGVPIGFDVPYGSFFFSGFLTTFGGQAQFFECHVNFDSFWNVGGWINTYSGAYMNIDNLATSAIWFEDHLAMDLGENSQLTVTTIAAFNGYRSSGDYNTAILVQQNSKLLLFWTGWMQTMAKDYCVRIYAGASLIEANQWSFLLDEPRTYTVNCTTAFLIGNNAEINIEYVPNSLSAVTQLYAPDFPDSARVLMGPSRRTPVGFVTQDGSFDQNRHSQRITATSPVNITLGAAEIPIMVHDMYKVYSKTAFAHVLTLLDGIQFVGGTTVATFGGAVGDGLAFEVLEPNLIVVTSNQNVVLS